MSIKAIPLLVFSLILYNVVVYLGGAGSAAPDIDGLNPAFQTLQAEFFSVMMPSGGNWVFTMGDLLIIISLMLLGIEVIKATYTRGSGLADQAFSMVVFVAFLVQFLLDPNASTSTFFALTLMAFIDVVAGAIIGIRTARRDIGFGGADA